jgi:hypothetical protein
VVIRGIFTVRKGNNLKQKKALSICRSGSLGMHYQAECSSQEALELVKEYGIQSFEASC